MRRSAPSHTAIVKGATAYAAPLRLGTFSSLPSERCCFWISGFCTGFSFAIALAFIWIVTS